MEEQHSCLDVEQLSLRQPAGPGADQVGRAGEPPEGAPPPPPPPEISAAAVRSLPLVCAGWARVAAGETVILTTPPVYRY